MSDKVVRPELVKSMHFDNTVGDSLNIKDWDEESQNSCLNRAHNQAVNQYDNWLKDHCSKAILEEIIRDNSTLKEGELWWLAGILNEYIVGGSE